MKFDSSINDDIRVIGTFTFALMQKLLGIKVIIPKFGYIIEREE